MLLLFALSDGQVLHGLGWHFTISIGRLILCSSSFSSLNWVMNGKDIRMLAKEPFLALFLGYSIHAILRIGG